MNSGRLAGGWVNGQVSGWMSQQESGWVDEQPGESVYEGTEADG